MRRLLPILTLLLLASISEAQDVPREVPLDTLNRYGRYDTDRLPPSFHAARRRLVLDSMGPHTIAVFLSAKEKIRANDIDYEFHQDPNFYYLTGCLEPKSALILSKDPITVGGRTLHEILFVQSRDPKQETWTGKRLGQEGAMSVLRPEYSLPIDSLKIVLARICPQVDTLFYRPVTSQKDRDPVLDVAFGLKDSTKAVEAPYHLIQSGRINRVLTALREVKTPEELQLMRHAIAISNEAHNAVIHTSRPGWYEYQIQGLAESIFAKNGAEYTAYPCIVGSGPNSTILHYETNRRQTKPGDFIEMDMGAEYHGYAADVTRSFPISGHFTPEQRAIYSLVLEAQDSGIKACEMGAPFTAAHIAARRVIIRGLQQLRIIYDSAEYKQYFMHGTSHYLGLDVHDAGTYGPLRPGNVLTVEPGIYIAEGSPCDRKWWNIGCRIEDDILITPNGPENLSRNSPRTIPDLERLMVRSR